MRASRARVLERNACPPWRHAVFAGLMAGVVAAQAAPERVFFALLAVLFVGMGLFYVVTKARRGVFINGWRAGATRSVSLAIFGVYMAIYSLTWWLKVEHGLWVAPLIGAAVLFPFAWYASARWMQVFRKEMAA
ncbi:hypothetical protein BH09PSE2_BH09PSE2_17030 [soil metagenome]